MIGRGQRQREGKAGEGEGSATAIPDKLYFRIGEVAALCGVATSVLRFWEGEFPQLKPNKGGNGQRLYRRRDLEMALRIKGLLYGAGMTIPGARRALTAEPATREPQLSFGIVENEGTEHVEPADPTALRQLRSDLVELAEMLALPPEGTLRRPRTAKLARMTKAGGPSTPELFPTGHSSPDG